MQFLEMTPLEIDGSMRGLLNLHKIKDHWENTVEFNIFKNCGTTLMVKSTIKLQSIILNFTIGVGKCVKMLSR